MDNARCRSVIKDTNDLSKHFSTNTAPMTDRSIKDIKVFITNTGCRYTIYISYIWKS